MLEMINIVKRFGHHEAVRNINLYLDKGESVGLLGPNGSGKSTTDLPPDSRVVQRGVQSITSFESYTVGMSVMFALFAAGFVAIYALTEKKTHVFARMMLANTSRGKYLFSKWLLTTGISLVQLVLLFIITSLVFQVEWPNLTAALSVSFTFSMAIGGIGALLTSINFALNSDKASTVFQLMFTSLMAFVGGSLLPIKEMSPLLGRIGEFTPNGRALSGYLQILNGQGIADIVDTHVPLCCFTCGPGYRTC